MTPGPISWESIAELFNLLAQVYRGGNAKYPDIGEVADEALEAEIDDWCRQVHLHIAMDDMPLPPRSLLGWMLVRLTCVTALARSLAKNGSPSPGPLDRSLIEQLLIEEWHGAQKALWQERSFRNPY